MLSDDEGLVNPLSEAKKSIWELSFHYHKKRRRRDAGQSLKSLGLQKHK
jgi:hypothetical protein